MEPGAKEDGRFLTAREDPTAGADVGFDLQLLCPGTQRIWAKYAQQLAPALQFVSITRRKVSHRLTVGKIQSATTGDEKLATGGRLSVANENARTGFGRDLGRAQTGGAGP